MKHALVGILLLFAPGSVLAGTSELAPAQISMQGLPNEIISQVLHITNASDTEQRYELRTDLGDAPLGSHASAQPQTFTLAPHAAQDVVIRVRMPHETRTATLALVAFDRAQQSAQLAIGNGMMIPVELVVPSVAGAMISRAAAARNPLLIYSLASAIAPVLLAAVWIGFGNWQNRKSHKPQHGRISFV